MTDEAHCLQNFKSFSVSFHVFVCVLVSSVQCWVPPLFTLSFSFSCLFLASRCCFWETNLMNTENPARPLKYSHIHTQFYSKRCKNGTNFNEFTHFAVDIDYPFKTLQQLLGKKLNFAMVVKLSWSSGSYIRFLIGQSITIAITIPFHFKPDSISLSPVISIQSPFVRWYFEVPFSALLFTFWTALFVL